MMTRRAFAAGMLAAGGIMTGAGVRAVVPGDSRDD